MAQPALDSHDLLNLMHKFVMLHDPPDSNIHVFSTHINIDSGGGESVHVFSTHINIDSRSGKSVSILYPSLDLLERE